MTQPPIPGQRWLRAASVLALVAGTCGPADAATVKKADDTTVSGPLIGLENGAVVLNVTPGEGKPPVRTLVPLADVVEVTIDPATDVPTASPAPAEADRPAGDAPPPPPVEPPAPAAEGAAGNFESLFDGKELKGWTGDPKLWSVREGAITGIANEGNLTEGTTFLHWTGGDLTDFELRFRYQISGGHPGSSGVVYRGKLLDAATFQVGGYQFDIGDDPKVTGSLYDEGGVAGNRGFLANVGEKVVHRPGGARDVAEASPGKDVDALRAGVKRGDWNDAVITASGNRLVHIINGNVMADVTDESPAALKSGVLALQLDLRQQVVVRFKDIQLRRTGGGGSAAPGDGKREWVVRLRGGGGGGDQLRGELLGWDDKQLKLKTAYGELAVPVTQLREVWHAPAEEIAKARAASAGGGGAGRAGTEDVAFARREDQVVPVGGLALGVDGGALRFRFRDQERKIALDRLVGVTLAAADDEDATGAAADGPLLQSFVLAGGSGDVMSGTWAALDAAAGVATLKTPWGEPLDVPMKEVERIATRNGRLVYLSDLPPAEVEQVPYFDRLLPYRVDRSLTGGPIKLADAEHARGIAVHSRTVLRYDVGGRFERFRTRVGFQQPEGKAGRAVVRVLGDGDKVLHEIPDARGDQPPADLDLDVTGVGRLTLEVDFGADQDIADRVVWADARLIRATPARAEAR